MARAAWYIHLHDPGFVDPPWPGVKRLGPFTSAKQALEQAASDLAGGSGAGVLGIYTGTNSDALRDVESDEEHVNSSREAFVEHWTNIDNIRAITEEVPMAVTLEEIQARADEIVEERAAILTQEIQDTKEAIMQTDALLALPEDQREKAATDILKLTRLVY